MGAQQTKVDTIDRQRQALELRRAGVSYRQIADHLGYAGPSGAHRAVASALKETLQEPADALRDLEAQRLDALQRALWPAASAGDVPAVRAMLSVMERRAKLLGLDSPQRNELSGPNGTPFVPVTPEDMAARFEQLVRAQRERLKHAPKEVPDTTTAEPAEAAPSGRPAWTDAPDAPRAAPARPPRRVARSRHY